MRIAARYLNAAAQGLAVFALAALVVAAPPGEPPPQPRPPSVTPGPMPAAAKKGAAYRTETLRGKIAWLSEALARRHGVRLDADAAESQTVLETAAGELIPLMKEDRGRGFWKDARLRGREVELFVRRYEGAPHVQVLRVFSLQSGKKYEIDYWCDVCAIQMFELKACECCQGPTRLREREVTE